MNFITKRLSLAAVLAGLCLCGPAKADDEDWKPHPTAFTARVSVSEDAFGRQQIQTADGKTWVLVQGEGIPSAKHAASDNIFCPEIALDGSGLSFLRYFPDGWREGRKTGLFLQLGK